MLRSSQQLIVVVVRSPPPPRCIQRTRGCRAFTASSSYPAQRRPSGLHACANVAVLPNLVLAGGVQSDCRHVHMATLATRYSSCKKKRQMTAHCFGFHGSFAYSLLQRRTDPAPDNTGRQSIVASLEWKRSASQYGCYGFPLRFRIDGLAQ